MTTSDVVADGVGRAYIRRMASFTALARRAPRMRAKLLLVALFAVVCGAGCDGCQKKQVPVTMAPG